MRFSIDKNTKMRNVILLAVALWILSVASSQAGDCERYKFGSQDWWDCKNYLNWED